MHDASPGSKARTVSLQPVDAVEVTLVVDTYVDLLLAGQEGLRRFPGGRPRCAGHCTGWEAVDRLAATMPEAFVQPSVGTVYRFG